MSQFNPFISGGGGGSGKDGRGIASIVFTSSTGGSIAGVAGATDTYTINYSDTTTSTYIIKNGENGLNGENGKSAYELAVEGGYQGTLVDWLNSLNGTDGKSLVFSWDDYNLGIKQDGNSEFTYQNLRGPAGLAGPQGESAYELAVRFGYEGTLEEWIASLKGERGTRGAIWTVGTSIVGENVDPTSYNTGIEESLIGDYYFNSELRNIYKCVVGGNAETAKWIFDCHISSAGTIEVNSVDTVVSITWTDSTQTISSPFIKSNSLVTVCPSSTITADQYDALAKIKPIALSQIDGSFTIKSLGTLNIEEIPITLIIETTIVDEVI